VGEAAPFAVAVCDVNGLKTVNDTLGHQAGDQLIRDASRLICERLPFPGSKIRLMIFFSVFIDVRFPFGRAQERTRLLTRTTTQQISTSAAGTAARRTAVKVN